MNGMVKLLASVGSQSSARSMTVQTECKRLLGAIGGASGKGKKKVRGDSNYYRLLRYKGIEKKRKKDAETESK